MGNVDFSRLTGKAAPTLRQGAANDKDLQAAHKIFNDEWGILKKYYTAPEWVQLIKELDGYAEGYKDTPSLKALALNMAIGVYGFLGISSDGRDNLKRKKPPQS